MAAITYSNPAKFTINSIPILADKTFIVTGGNTGIGYQTSLNLARKAARVFIAGRNPARVNEAIEKMKKEVPGARVEHLLLDLQDLKQVKSAADSFLAKGIPLDGLINNAGIMATPWSLSKDGIESQFATNHLGHFLFTRELIPALLKAENPRIVVLSSVGHTMCPKEGIKFNDINNETVMSNTWERYGQSKVANILFVRKLVKLYPQIYSNNVHPGWVYTELNRGPNSSYGKVFEYTFDIFNRAVAITPQQGALGSLYCATSPDIVEKNIRGKYFVPYTKIGESNAISQSDELADKLWEFSNDLVEEKLKA